MVFLAGPESWESNPDEPQFVAGVAESNGYAHSGDVSMSARMEFGLF